MNGNVLGNGRRAVADQHPGASALRSAPLHVQSRRRIQGQLRHAQSKRDHRGVWQDNNGGRTVSSRIARQKKETSIRELSSGHS